MAIAEFVELSGLEKASVLLMTLGANVSAQVFKHLSEEEIEKLSGEIIRIREADPRLKQAVLAEFERAHIAQSLLESDGKDFATQVLRQAMGEERATEVMDKASRSGNGRPFAFLQRATPDRIARTLAQEPAPVISLVLKNVPPETAAEVLPQLSEELQAEVAIGICASNEVDPDVLAAIEEALQAKYNTVLKQRRTPEGPGALVEILNRSGRSTEKALLNALKKQSPSVGEQVRSMMFVFEDLLKLDDRSIRLILRHLDEQILCLSLKGADDSIRELFFRNMSERAVEALKADLEIMVPITVKSIEIAQKKIADIARSLIAREEIAIQPASEVDEA